MRRDSIPETAVRCRPFAPRPYKGGRSMNLRERIRSWLQSIYFVGQNTVTLTGVVITTSTALTTIAFWLFEIFLPAPPHPYIGILLFLISPGIFFLGLLLIPLGICLRRRLSERGG